MQGCRSATAASSDPSNLWNSFWRNSFLSILVPESRCKCKCPPQQQCSRVPAQPERSSACPLSQPLAFPVSACSSFSWLPKRGLDRMNLMPSSFLLWVNTWQWSTLSFIGLHSAVLNGNTEICATSKLFLYQILLDCGVCWRAVSYLSILNLYWILYIVVCFVFVWEAPPF